MMKIFAVLLLLGCAGIAAVSASPTLGACVAYRGTEIGDSSTKSCSECQMQCLTWPDCTSITFDGKSYTKKQLASWKCGDAQLDNKLCVQYSETGNILDASRKSCQECAQQCYYWSGCNSMAWGYNNPIAHDQTINSCGTGPVASPLPPTPPPPSPAGLVPVTIDFTGDNTAEVYVDGNLVTNKVTAWNKAERVTLNLARGQHTIAVKVTSTEGWEAFIAIVSYSNNNFVTDGSWKATHNPGTGDWKAANYDDSKWPAATNWGAYGVAPWLKNVNGFPTTPVANWIGGPDYTTLQPVYLRKKFTV